MTSAGFSLTTRVTNMGSVPAVVLGMIVLPYFLVRGWLNAGGTLFALLALGVVLKEGTWKSSRKSRHLGLMVAALAAPFALTAIAQAIHGEFAPRYLDPPLRLALGGALLVYLHDRKIDWLPIASVVIPGAVILCAVMIYLPGAENYYWGTRAASYFMDPLMLSQHAALFGFLSLFLITRDDALPARMLKAAGGLAGMAVAISTGSRTGWVMIPLLGILWMLREQSEIRPGRVALSLALVIGGGAMIYAFSATVHTRVEEIFSEVVAYFGGGNRDTSIGTRLSLFRLAWAAFLERPWTGWGFVSQPTSQLMPSTAALWTEMTRNAFVNNGIHNEWLQHMMRMGVLGFIGRATLYLVPLAVFASAIRKNEGRQRRAGYLGLAVVIAYLTASFTSEVSNLVYLSTFYGLMVASFGAIALRPHST